MSYRFGFREHMTAKFYREIAWLQKINPDTQVIFQLSLQPPQIEQGRPWKGIHQKVQIAALLVVAIQYRAEYT